MLTIRSLIGRESLGLDWLAGVADAAALDVPVTWAYHTNLSTPVPYLRGGELVLTTMTQFRGVRELRPALTTYVEQLRRWGISGLVVGAEEFGAPWNEALRDGMAMLRETADRVQLPLAVAARRPFIHVVREIVEAITVEQLERERHRLEVQRRLSDASLRDDSVTAILEEVEWSLGCWALCLDATGGVIGASTRANAVEEGTLALVRREGVHLLGKRLRARARVLLGTDGEATVQTLGEPDDPLGAFVYGPTADGPDEERSAAASAASLLTLAILRRRDTLSARSEVLSAAMRLVLLGHPREAGEVCGGTVRLPEPPVRLVAIAASDARTEERLIRRLLAGAGLVAHHRARLLWLVGSAAEATAMLDREQISAGVSAEAGYTEMDAAARQAEAALAISQADGGGVTVFGRDPQGGLLQTVPLAPGFAQEARTLVAPLLDDPSGRGGTLAESLYQWLSCQGEWEAAARERGVHRHTLRQHVTRAAEILDVDLDFPDTRVELWLALHLARERQAGRGEG